MESCDESTHSSLVTLFYSYALEDEALRHELEKHLSILQRRGSIATWHDRQIVPGSDWAQTIDYHLNNSSIILLLISPDFLASDYCYSIEMQRALERHKSGDACVIPIILRPVDWDDAPFAQLQCLPFNRKPITLWDNLDAAFSEVARGIRTAIKNPKGFSFSTVLDSPRSLQNRDRLLNRVHKFWIKGVLEQSLHHAALVALGLREQPNAIENPWRLMVQESEQPAHLLPAGTRIKDVYDEADGELLILGEPGAGKTTLLLELARDLLNRAGLYEHYPMPVVFNLSSWAEKRGSIATWLIEELYTKYQVPRKVAKEWIDTDQILLLLDGLDEVTSAHRSTCIEAINAYRLEHYLVSVIVCSRSSEYFAQTRRISLHRAVVVQPLTAQQIDEYLAGESGKLEALRKALQDDPGLQEIAEMPLMLNILTLAYQGRTVDDLLALGSPELRRSHIFNAYIQRMFEHRGSIHPYTFQQTTHWLTWLAQQMIHHNQTEFYIERLQIDWLPKSRQSQLYPSLAVGLVCSLIGTCGFGIMYSSFLDGLLIGLFAGVVYILLNGILFGWLVEREMKSTGGPRWAALFTQLLGNRGSYGLLCGVLLGSFVGFLKGPNAGSISGLISAAYFVLLGKLDKKIQPAETIAWSWESVRQDGTKFLIGGLCMGFLYGCITAFPGLFNLSIFLPSLIFGLAVGLVIGLVITLIRGFSGSMLETKKIIKPNQGIWNSFYNSARLALLSGIAFGVVFYIFFSFIIYQVIKVGYVAYFPPNSGLIYGTSDGLVVASLIWLINGGFACIQHLLLRFLLWQTKCTPWRYSHFLDYATKRILLRKVGGGYIFVHRLLLEYFATLDRRIQRL